MTIAMMSVKIQNWPLLNTLMSNNESMTKDENGLENFLDSRLNKELLPLISSAF